MASAMTEGQTHKSIVSYITPFIFATFPTEIVRLVFEASVTPGLWAADEQQRQRTAYAYCLISKDVRAWVEPLLYEKVVLESRKQAMSFFRAMKNKPMQFLAHAVKTVWILDEYPHDSSDQLHILFSRCILLKRLTIIESELSMDIMRNIPKPLIGPYALQELTIVDARLLTARKLDLPHLTLQKLHIINCSSLFLIVLFRRALGNKGLLDTLRLIPQIYLDFTTIPSVKTSALIKCRAIPLWISSSPESISVLHIRSSSDTPAQNIHSSANNVEADRDPRYREEHFNGVDSWIKYFDMDVKECGGRLVVHALPDMEFGSNRKPSYILRCMAAWVGLH